MKSKRYIYDYPRPALTADALVITVHEGTAKLLLIQRKHPPFTKRWALPGGFVNDGETLKQAALRELEEETGVAGLSVIPFGCYGDPGRDPRGWTVTAAFLAVVPWSAQLEARGSDDASQALWHPVTKLPRLAFDHDKIIAEGLAYVAEHRHCLSCLKPADRRVMLAAVTSKSVRDNS
jgi:8-oxo-dGTP diphosphatase